MSLGSYWFYFYYRIQIKEKEKGGDSNQPNNHFSLCLKANSSHFTSPKINSIIEDDSEYLTIPQPISIKHDVTGCLWIWTSNYQKNGIDFIFIICCSLRKQDRQKILTMYSIKKEQEMAILCALWIRTLSYVDIFMKSKWWINWSACKQNNREFTHPRIGNVEIVWWTTSTTEMTSKEWEIK